MSPKEHVSLGLILFSILPITAPAGPTVKHEANIYDIEPHTENEEGILKQNRYKQARIDSKYVKSGWKTKDFVKMNNLYVIMITNFDMFGEGLFEYTVKNKILERPDLEYDDGLTFKYFQYRLFRRCLALQQT